MWPPEGQLARGQTSLLFVSVPLQLAVHPVQWERGSLTDIYLHGYGVCFQTGKWLFADVFISVCVCVDEDVPFGAE